MSPRPEYIERDDMVLLPGGCWYLSPYFSNNRFAYVLIDHIL
jgi:hypothetical protein